MREVAVFVDRNRKLFFKDKGMLFSSMITPLILIVLYATFLAKIYKDSYTSAFNNMVILVLFGSTLSSIISYPLKTQGQTWRFEQGYNQKIIKKTPDIDDVSGAMVTSNAIKNAVAKCLEQTSN